MRRFVLFYLFGILIIPISLRIVFGKLDHLPLHPGLFIHGIMLFLLFVYFYRRINKSIPKHIIMYMIVGFSSVYLVNLFVIEMVQFSDQSIYQSLEYTFKIFLLLFLSFYVIDNHEYFKLKADKILLINSFVIILNIILGHFFNFGWQTYERTLGENYRGYLAGNDTSIFSFVAFGYSIFSVKSAKTYYKKILYIILIILSIYSMYIIGTKAIFVAGIIYILFSLNKETIREGKLYKTIVTIVLGATCILILTHNPFNLERFFLTYLSQRAKGEDFLLMNVQAIPAYLKWLNMIAPGRITLGFILLGQMFNDSLLNLLFGYGVSGIYEAFGRPPMAHLFSVIGHYGIFGFIVFYVPQLLHSIQIIKKRQFDLINVLFITIFLYGSLGGFLYGVSNISILFALLFALSLAQVNPKMKIHYIK